MQLPDVVQPVLPCLGVEVRDDLQLFLLDGLPTHDTTQRETAGCLPGQVRSESVTHPNGSASHVFTADEPLLLQQRLDDIS